ncbi:uncharacterized protein LOC144716092 [Wolffia australiana]
MPHNTARIMKGELESLKMMGNLREYVGQFVSIIRRITDMSEADKLYRFAKGLPHWLQIELERRQCKDLNSAYKVVESIELRPARPAKTEDRPMKGNKQRQERAEAPATPSSQGLKRKFKQCHGKSRDKGNSLRLWKQNPGGGGKKLTCFACGGPHFMKDCPRGTVAPTNVNAMVVPPPQPDVPRGSSTVTLNPLHCLAALQWGAPVQYEGLNLLHIPILINGKPSTAMVDTGATHSVLTEKEAKKLGLKLSPSAGKIKVVNSEARDIVGVAKGVLYRGVQFPEGSHPCFVRDQGVQKPQNTALMSAIWGDDDDNNPGAAAGGLPVPIADVLLEFSKVMPTQLLAKLSPRGDVDQEIKLLPRTRPPAQAPYKMPPAYLEELRKQLQELLESKLVRPSKAPFGAPVLFQKKKDGSLRLCVDYRALNKRKFIKGFSRLAAPLTDLMKKDVKWQWTDRCQRAFDKLKSVVSNELVLRLPKFHKPYEDGHPVAYKSRKLNDAERRYSVHEKEMTALYKLGRANQVADGLSRKKPEVFVAALSAVQGSILDEIKLALKDDPKALRLMKRIATGKTRRFWTEDGIIYVNGNRLYVPCAGGLRRKLLYEAHDAPHAGHTGQARTLALLSSIYHWPGME